jgi:hypothetical protein
MLAAFMGSLMAGGVKMARSEDPPKKV